MPEVEGVVHVECVPSLPLSPGVLSHTHAQGQDCNPPGNPSPFSCFFDDRVWARIRATPGNELLRSFTFEESEFALPLSRIPDFVSDMQQLAFGSTLNGTTWPISFILFRPGGTTRDLIHPATTTSAVPQRIVWVELATFRPNIFLPLDPSFPAGLRLQKKLLGIQEAFEQLMTCK